MLKSQAQPDAPVLVAVDAAASHADPDDGRSSEPAPPPARSRRGLLIVVAVIALLASIAGGRMWWRGHYYVETEDAYATGHVHPVSARVAGIVVSVNIKDNQKVQAGDVIAELDPTDQRIKAEQIAAQIQSVEQQIAQVDAQVAQARAQAGGAAAQVAQSAAMLRRAELDAERYSKLFGSQLKAVSAAEVDGAEANLAAARAEQMGRRDAVRATQAQVAAAMSSRDVIKSQIRVLQVQLKEAQQQLAYNRITVLVAGTVGKRSLEVGMRVQPGQQLAAIVQDNVWVTANFKETQLAGLHRGQEAKVTFDAMPDRPLRGRIDSFSPAAGAQFALLPADNATGNFTKIVQRVPVKILLRQEDVDALDRPLVPGMSALVQVRKAAAAEEPAPLAPLSGRGAMTMEIEPPKARVSVGSNEPLKVLTKAAANEPAKAPVSVSANDPSKESKVPDESSKEPPEDGCRPELRALGLCLNEPRQLRSGPR